jgi:hypothetical protein
MKRIGPSIVIGLVVAGALLSGCGQPAAAAPKEAAITIEKHESGPATITLSAKAAERLGVQTGEVRGEGAQKTIPYAAVIYDAQGATWAYTATGTLVYQRASISVDRIEGDGAFLTDGPPSGTAVVTLGAAELYGAETGVGGGH